ncbi:methyltransferase domain-containing protein [Candidatus Dojkabacteria bacterium]|nr:methyltransferase domain-containing protein [Candidatus Dojkabacteria bacterium]
MSYLYTIDSLEFLTSPKGTELITVIDESLVDTKNELCLISKLSKKYESKYIGAAMDLVLNRKLGIKKFTKAQRMFFTKDALEQSSNEQISFYRAGKFKNLSKVCDLGCGIGSDTIQLARYCKVVAVDKDPIRLKMAELNAEVYGVRENIEFINMDFTSEAVPDCDAIFIDPSRRIGDRRVFSIFDYEPSLDIVKDLMKKTINVCVKASPGISFEGLNQLGSCSVEIVSLNGECKEAILWFGGFKKYYKFKATLLPFQKFVNDRWLVSRPEISVPQKFIYEPDCSINRAHLVDQVATRYKLNKLNHSIAYLTSNSDINEVFFEKFEVIDHFPFEESYLRKYLKDNGIGIVEIKKRGVPMEVDEVRKKLKLKSKKRSKMAVVIILTLVDDRITSIICKRVS